MSFGKANCIKCGRPIKLPVGYGVFLFGKATYCSRCYDNAYSKWENDRDKFKKKYENETEPCCGCDGTGRIKGYTCQSCDGSGKTKKSVPAITERVLGFAYFNGVPCEDA